MTNINIGHLTHIEKGERNPSHKALKTLSIALDVPYQPLMYTYDKELTRWTERILCTKSYKIWPDSNSIGYRWICRLSKRNKSSNICFEDK